MKELIVTNLSGHFYLMKNTIFSSLDWNMDLSPVPLMSQMCLLVDAWNIWEQIDKADICRNEIY